MNSVQNIHSNNNLNDAQTKAVKASFNSPLLIVAGAGTGKTRTLTARVVEYMKQYENDPSKICAITFTNKAAGEMRDRIKKTSPKMTKKKPFIGTFHSLGALILRKEARSFGRSPGFTIFDEQDVMSIIKKIIKSQKVENKKASSIRKEISKIKRGSKSHKDEDRDEIMDVFFTYEKELESQNAFDFDDLLSKAVSALQKDPERLSYYKTKFSHLFIDEYQDINKTQHDLISLLSNGSITAVGDIEQTIYGWRGSDINMFLNFNESWPNAKILFLEENYRSSGNIISASTEMILNNEYEKGVVQNTRLFTSNPEGEKIGVYGHDTPEDEAEWLAEYISGHKEEHGYKTAILYRTNAQSRALESALVAEGVQYRVYGGLRFYDRKEIRDIVASVRLVANPKDKTGEERLKKVFPKKIWEPLLGLLAEFNKNDPPAVIIGGFLKNTNYLALIEKSYMNARDRVENIKELISFASGFDNLTDFLERISLLESTDRAKEAINERGVTNTPEPITLMTIHMSKGLEFDRVFIAGCTEGVLPHVRSLGSKEELQEERRLAYVAMTRAKKILFMSFYGLPSRFLGELPGDKIDVKSNSLDRYGEIDPCLDEESYITLD